MTVSRSERVTIPLTTVKLPKLKHLIYGNNMREVPTDLFSNSAISSVDLHDNILGFVPKEVCMLAKLKVLHLNGNQHVACR